MSESTDEEMENDDDEFQTPDRNTIASESPTCNLRLRAAYSPDLSFLHPRREGQAQSLQHACILALRRIRTARTNILCRIPSEVCQSVVYQSTVEELVQMQIKNPLVENWFVWWKGIRTVEFEESKPVSRPLSQSVTLRIY